MIPTQSNRERRQPDDVRLELFVPYYHNNHNNNNKNKLISDEIVRRFRSWKTKYFQLIRAIEWCLPDQEALTRTVHRVRSYGKDRYNKFFELDGSCLECAQELSSSCNNNNNTWSEIISEIFLTSTTTAKQENSISTASCCCQHKNNNNNTNIVDDDADARSQNGPSASSPAFGLALLVVFGSAADPLMITNTNNNHNDSNNNNNNNLGPKVPNSSSSSVEQQRQELYEKKKKIKVDNIGGGNNKKNIHNNNNNNKLSFFKTVDSTSRSLKGFLINNITDPDIIDTLIQRHLLKLIIQMKIQSKIPINNNANDYCSCPSNLLKAFVPIIYEPVRRCSSVLALGDTIFVIEPFLYARDAVFSCLRDLLRSSSFSKIYLLVLGDVRDAVLMSKSDVENVVASCATSQQNKKIEVGWIYNNTDDTNINSSKIQKFEFFASGTNKVDDNDDDDRHKNISSGLTFTIQHFDFGFSVACLQSFSSSSSSSQHDNDAFPLVSFTGDFVSLDSYIKQLFDNTLEVPQQKFLSGVLSTYQQQLEFEANMLKKKQQNQEAGESQVDENIVVTNDTLLFPSHGGYSWVTHQLDLSWAGFAYLTNKSLFSTNSVTTTTTNPNPNSVPKIVAGGLHQLIWRKNQEIISSKNHYDKNNNNPSFESYVEDLLSKTTLTYSSNSSNIAAKFLSFFKTAAAATNSSIHTSSPGRAMFDPSVPLVVDTRSPEEYEGLRIAGSLSIPFALEESSKSSKKAELWLSQLASVPGQKIILVLPRGHETEVLKRVCCILPLSSSSNGGSGNDDGNSNSTIELLACLIVGNREEKNVLECLSETTAIRFIRGKSSFFSTASSYEEVADILSRSNNSDDKNNENNHFVIDCRTPIEFAQGSHIDAANIPLADFRFWLMMMMMMMTKNNNSQLPFTLAKDIKDWISSTNSSNRGSIPEKMKFLPSRKELFTNFHSFREVTTEEEDLLRGVYVGFHKSEVPCFEYLLSKIFTKTDDTIIINQSSAEANTEKEKKTNTTLLIYCAGGYRSRIFMSIFEAVMMLTVETDSASVRVCDVGRGAVELMSQHAERWTVKDRGIVCVS